MKQEQTGQEITQLGALEEVNNNKQQASEHPAVAGGDGWAFLDLSWLNFDWENIEWPDIEWPDIDLNIFG